MPTRRAACSLALLLALAVSACGDDGGRDVVGTSGRSASAEPSSPTGEPTGTTSPSPSTTSPSPAFPPAVRDVQHGDQVWAVYLAVARLGEDGRPHDPDGDLDRARRQAAAAGYEGAVGGGQVECDRGAREALGLDPARGYHTASIFFATREDAQQFVAAYEPGVVGTAQITAYCLD